jgi:hypothetical protein
MRFAKRYLYNELNLEGLELQPKRGAKKGNTNSKGPRLVYTSTVEEGKQFASSKHFLKYKRELLAKQNAKEQK